MKKLISIFMTLALLFSVFALTEIKIDASAQVHNAFDDFDTQNADGSNTPWLYLYTEDDAKTFFYMDNTADVLGIKWYPPKGKSTNTALGYHDRKASLRALIIDTTPGNASMAVLAFVAPEDGFYKIFAEMYGHLYDGQRGDSFYIYKDNQNIAKISFGIDRSVHLEYTMDGAIKLDKGDKIYFYQKSGNDTHHSAFVNAIVEGPISQYKGKVFVPKNSNEPTQAPVDETKYFYTNLGMSPGKDHSEINFNWITNSKTKAKEPIIQFVEQSDFLVGGFDSANVRTVSGLSNATINDFVENKITITNLLEDTKYFYRITSEDSPFWSDTYFFETRNPKDYEFIFISDAQIGASGDIEKDTNNFIDTLNKATSRTPAASFILSAGDQVEHGMSMDEFNGFFTPNHFRNYPLAIALGNHENWTFNTSYLFNLPNKTGLGASNADSNYYFSYGDTLFIVLNSNSVNAINHRETFRQAVSSHKEAKWKVVMMHHNMYSSGYWYSNSTSTINLRERFYPIMDEYGIDVVLNGHDHSYARSKFMYNNIPVIDQHLSNSGSFIYPEGTVYITANSSTGSKYYEITDNAPSYIEARNQVMSPTFTKVKVDDNQFVLETYITDTMELVDAVTIQKAVYNKEDLNVFINKANQIENTNYDFDKWNLFLNEIENAKEVADDANSVSADYNNALTLLLKAQKDMLNSILDTKNLVEQVNLAQSLYDNSVEGDEPGQYEQGAKAKLLVIIKRAKDLLVDNETRQSDVDQMGQELNNALMNFQLKRIKLEAFSEESITYNAYDDFDSENADSKPWQYLYTLGNGEYELLETFELNGWRAVSESVWAGIAKNSDVPGLVEFNTGYGGQHIGVLAFVAPENGVYKINEFIILGNMWEQQVDEFFIVYENEVLQSRKFEYLPETKLQFYEYLLEMEMGDKLYFYATKSGESASVYTNIVIEQLIMSEEFNEDNRNDDSNLSSIQKAIIVISIFLLLSILGGSIAYITVKYKGKSKN